MKLQEDFPIQIAYKILNCNEHNSIEEIEQNRNIAIQNDPRGEKLFNECFLAIKDSRKNEQQKVVDETTDKTSFDENDLYFANMANEHAREESLKDALSYCENFKGNTKK